ncbi:MAG: EpsI family protein [Deltaproteobacteria bacterium]|nr:EpsI family protein [Deltaproteobacteria bacterium]
MTLMRERLAQLGPLLFLGMVAVAFRPLLDAGLELPGRQQAESWFFAPDEKSPWLAIGMSAWLIWRRRDRLRAASARARGGTNHALTAALLLTGLVCFGWAQHVRAADLLLPALGFHILALASALAGAAGCRVLLLPALVLSISMPLPSPLHNEVVWTLQRWTATCASGLLDLMGFETMRADAYFRVGTRAFLVVEACSGLRGLEILTLVAIAIREVFADAGAKLWWTVVSAPVLSVLLNVARVTSVPFTEDPGTRVSIARGHLGQGLGVLVMGTVLLYLLGLLLARGRTGHTIDEQGRAPADSAWPSRQLGYAANAWAGLLVAVSFMLAPSQDVVDPPIDMPFPTLEIPREHAGWKGEDLRPDTLMIGLLPLGEIFHRRYERPGALRSSVVDLFIAYADEEADRLSPFSSKLLLPGHGWSLEERTEGRIWDLGIDVARARVRSDGAHKLVYRWHLRDPGAWRGNVRSLLALEAVREEGGRRRVVVRVSTPLGGPSPLAKDQSKQALDRFVRDFRDHLADL